MKHFTSIGHLDVWPFAASLYARRRAFDAVTLRQDTPGSPHKDTRSIFLRGPENPTVERWFEDVPHKDYALLDDWPEAGELIDRIMGAVYAQTRIGVHFGKIMVIELKPGGALAWHRDEGPYAALHDRYHLPIVTNPLAGMYAGSEYGHLMTGMLTRFDNAALHSAVNHGESPRIHLVCDVRKG